MSDLSYNVGYPVGASQLLGVGKTPTHLVLEKKRKTGFGLKHLGYLIFLIPSLFLKGSGKAAPRYATLA